MILLLSTSDTDLLSARASGADYRLGNPARLGVDDLPELVEGADLVVVRILGGRRIWEEGLDHLLAGPRPVVVLGGEQNPDAELMELSTVPGGVCAEAHTYLAHGGSANLAQLHAFLSDTVLLTGVGFEPPVAAPNWGLLERPEPAGDPDEGTRPTVAVLYYRAHHVAGNTAFVHSLCDAVEAKGGRALPIFCSSLRTAEPELLAELRKADALVVTVLAAGGTKPATASAGGDDDAWDVGALAELDVPILQGLCLTSSRADWDDNDDGLSPLDTATQVAIPEFDGRIITVPFSFKEIDEDGLTVYVADPERALRVAGIAVRHGKLRHTPPADRKVVLMLSAYPTKHSRIGNAVGLDTPASAVRLLAALREQGYDLGEGFPGLDDLNGDALIHALIAAGGQDPDWLTEEQLQGNPVRLPAARYREWYGTLPEDAREDMERHWGPAPGELFVDRSRDRDGEIVLAALRSGNVVVMVQPPRGFGENPIAIYHDPDLPPSHHYLGAYRWLEAEFGADAVVHVGKHGNLEWLPGKTVGLSAGCGPDAALGDLPLIYPFLVNDPGEGTQAKRRAHATLVDHLVPPMARSDSYGDIARLEQLLDEHGNIAAMDPAKLPAIRAQIWTLIQAAKLDHDLGLTDRPHDAEFDELILHVDGWLCEIKDVQIRDGLHVLGEPPVGAARVNLVLAILQAPQVWAGQVAALPGLRDALGLKQGADRLDTDAAEQRARELVQAMEDADWAPEHAATLTDDRDVVGILEFGAREVVPRLARTTDEMTHVLHALSGGYVPAGPSGSPLRGLVNVLPTGRNFYSVDPKAVPSRLAWETGQAMADSLLERYRAETGEWPPSVGLSVWGTSAMRTSGDDIAEVLALLGVRPVWDEQSRRVTGLAVVDLEELGRPRIDVTVRISGFFRDAFPHVVALLDDAVRLVSDLDESDSDNFVRAHVRAALDEHGDDRRATMRIFGSKPGAYGAGLLPLIDSRNWRDDADLAEVYAVWGGYAYGRGLDGVQARPDMETAYKRIAVAAKNIDTREHDVIDSDDYFQYHGGMVATVRALTGKAPKAYVGDSTRPDAVRTRTLHEETNRIFRARVVNPRWLAAMRRHGYKGAFELAATVDYLFGYDATTGVVADWMYEKLAEAYVFDEENQRFLNESNPWALHGITERLLEAADRGLWEHPEQATLDALRAVYLNTEGDLEDRR
ncbi:cobaltochelatase subunit CobN [Actinosynnema pretiosum subsp. pretiosum]|uniref:Cobaltochelatase, CobN subunit n=2 Tax=Actinosynnema TaxID=40566 RepID=C6WCW5_ACTMD|nr:cobaltochelatase subunit CobN [Actinosynnema mirum]ACU35732.1 cobaltochelatase, CobN subunit [Actinosynnema mirum DSM 43827]AXX29157.1 CobN component of cobalt chelatase involved in B12 biosynthesis [Actinosynnema pretiosum subsp. pretiosum]QUF06570.1 cobaltochelatase subunit CobN [Actinosynnema pretiosum subsp. pretiosum]